MATRIELLTDFKILKEDYQEIINCINKALCSGNNFIEVTEIYTTSQYVNEFEEKTNTNFQKICININHIVCF